MDEIVLTNANPFKYGLFIKLAIFYTIRLLPVITISYAYLVDCVSGHRHFMQTVLYHCMTAVNNTN